MPEESLANWYRDPFGRHDLRYWDGGQWTQHVVSQGRQELESLGGTPAPTVAPGDKKVQPEARRTASVAAAAARGALLTEPILVVAQKRKLVQVSTGYTIRDEHGQQIGSVVEVGRNILKKMLSDSPDSDRAYTLHVLDETGRVRMVLTRPSKFFRSKLIVSGTGGAEIGRIVQKNLGIIGRLRFDLISRGKVMGSIVAKDSSSSEFTIRNTAGEKIGGVSKTEAGLSKMFMTGNDWVIGIFQPLDRPLRSLMIASSIAIDTALRKPPSPRQRSSLFGDGTGAFDQDGSA